MTHNRTLMLIAAVIIGISSTAGAVVMTTFNNSPETSPLVPAGGWVEPFPYQRDAYIGFGTDPSTWPADPVQGSDLIPGVNYDLQGRDDMTLYPSDWAEATGTPPEWFDTHVEAPGRQGMVGFLNTESVETSLVWHLDNWPDQRAFKHVWLEIEYYLVGSGTSLIDAYSASGPYTYFDAAIEDLGGGWYRGNAYMVFEPNPEWEEMSFTILIDPTAGGSVLIDYVHVATECVPEPASLSLLALGGLAVLSRRKTKRLR